MAIWESPYTSEWIKSNEKEKTKILWLKGKVENIISLHPLQLEILKVCKFFKSPMDAKNLK
jgi:hypothetical protein